MLSPDMPQPTEWTPQDWIFVIEALCFYATSEVVSELKYEYAHQLADEIAAQEGLPASELLLQAESLS